jgi:hypothetical protein
MKFENLQKLPAGQFRRLTGVKPKTFERMVEIIKEADERKRAKGGRPKKLCVEDRILMTLEYLREYRTYAHIGVSYGLSESNTFANIREIESILVKCEDFKLPGKKALLKSDHEFEIILVDVSESPIQRPKKNSGCSTPARKNVIL